MTKRGSFGEPLFLFLQIQTVKNKSVSLQQNGCFMIFFPNCKINIGLGITGKRDDGYHNIESVFYPVDLRDALEIRPNKEGKTCLTVSGLDIGETDAEDNLCMKAYRLLKKDYPQIGNVNIHLHKTIPAFAGLGGGSSDAAYTLRLLDFIFSLSLSEAQLAKYAEAIGSDCVFFTQDRPMHVSGRGEKLKAVDLSLKGKTIVLVKPDIRISTKEAYAGVTPRISMTDYGHLPDLEQWKQSVKNDFEQSLFGKYPLLEQIKQRLYACGAVYASLSGSGSCMYGIFNQEIDLNRLKYGTDTFLWQGRLR